MMLQVMHVNSINIDCDLVAWAVEEGKKQLSLGVLIQNVTPNCKTNFFIAYIP